MRAAILGADRDRLVTNLTGGAARLTYAHPLLALREELRRLNASHDAVLKDQGLSMAERRQLATQIMTEIREVSAAIVILQREAVHG